MDHSAANGEALRIIPMILQVSNLGNLLAEVRPHLEEQALPEFLSRQRWFGGKARTVQRVSIRDWAPLTPTLSPAGGDATSVTGPAIYFALIEALYRDGGAEQYFLPLALHGRCPSPPPSGLEREAAAIGPPPVVLEIRTASGIFVLSDALIHDATCELLLSAIEKQQEWPTLMGRLRAVHTADFAALCGPKEPPLTIARGAIEQSNTNIRYGDRFLLKLFRRCESGPNPEFEIIRFLTEKTGFQRIPRLAGAWLYQPNGDSEATLAMLAGWVVNDGNAWEEALQHVSRYFNTPHPRSPSGEGIGSYGPLAELLGRRTAELHLALASSAADPAFRPEPLTKDHLEALVSQTRDRAAQVFVQLRERLPDLPAHVRRQAADLQAVESSLRRLLTIPALDHTLSRIRCHGDYHLGQVLCAAGDYVILDFEGEPARPLAERRAKYSPLKDMAGMARSFHYAAYAALFQQPPEQQERLEAAADAWQWHAAEAFARGYRKMTAGTSFVPLEPGHFDALLNLFLLEKVIYEMSYELNNRPDWVIIPLHGLLALLRSKS